MKKRILLFLFLLASILLFSTCKRIEETWVKTHVDGKVRDYFCGKSIPNVEVAIIRFVSPTDPIVNSNEETIAKVFTDNEGNFSYSFKADYKDKEKPYYDRKPFRYKLAALKNGFNVIGIETNQIKSDELHKGKKNHANIYLGEFAILNITLITTNPNVLTIYPLSIDVPNIQPNVTILGEWHSIGKSYESMSVNTSRQFTVYSNRIEEMSWRYHEKNSSVYYNFSDSIFILPFQTNNYTITIN